MNRKAEGRGDEFGRKAEVISLRASAPVTSHESPITLYQA